MMTKGKAEYAERKAMENFDRWNNVTGVIEVNSGYYYEIQSVIEDAVHIGIQMALNGKITYGPDGEVLHGHSISIQTKTT